MTHLGYLIAGWGITLAVFGIYAASLIRRGRSLAARVPADRQRWITTKGSGRLDDHLPGNAR